MEVHMYDSNGCIMCSWETRDVVSVRALNAILLKYKEEYPDAVVSYNGEICIDYEEREN